MNGRKRARPCFACGCYPIGHGTDLDAGWLCAACHQKMRRDDDLARRVWVELETRVLDRGVVLGRAEAGAMLASLLELAMLETPA